MIDLQLIHEGGGRFRSATKLDHGIATEKFGAGEIVIARIGKRRSVPQHNWFFSMIAAAFDNQSAGPPFDDTEQLRAWLLIKAGHCDVKVFQPRSMTREVAAWLRMTFRAVDFTMDRAGNIHAKTPRSIAFSKCGAEDMAEIANRVVDVIMADIVPGSTRADWEPYLKEGAAKAERKAKRERRRENATSNG